MKQLYPRSFSKLLYVANEQFLSVIGGGGTASSGSGASGCPILIPTTVRNLSWVSRYDLGHQVFDVDIQKNGTNTGITISCPLNSTAIEKDQINEESYVAGDLIRASITGVGTTFANAFTGGQCIELEASENQYGIEAHGPDKVNNGEAWYGGIFGNGAFQRFASYSSYSSTKSIASMEGTITRLGIYNHGGDLGVGTWTAWLIKNKTPLDGSSGSIDTRISLTGATTFDFSSFGVTFVRGDVFDVLIQYLGPGTSLQSWHVSATITVTPANTGWFMLTGGSNNAMPNTATGWVWNRTEQLDTPEDNEITLIGPGGINCFGMFTTRTVASGASAGFVDTLRSNYADTALTSTMQGSDLEELVEATVVIPEDAIVNIQNAPFNTPSSSAKFYWGLSAEVITASVGATLIVTKVTDPGGSSQSFDFTTTGGLSPSTFSLTDGQVQQYTSLVAGTYGVAETPVSGWTTEVTVSNGDDADAITLADGDIVTVTFTNTQDAPPPNIGSGIYKIVPGNRKNNDTLWEEDFQSTIDVKIP